MASEDYIARCVNRLVALRLGNAPTTAEDIALLRVAWLDIFEDTPDDAFGLAIRRHLTNPDRGKWWPTPADILAAGGATVPEDPAEAAWNRIIDRIRDPRYRATDGSGRWDMTGALDAREQAALREIGGSAAVGKADDFQRKDLRARFVRKLRDGGTVLQLVRTAGGGA